MCADDKRLREAIEFFISNNTDEKCPQCGAKLYKCEEFTVAQESINGFFVWSCNTCKNRVYVAQGGAAMEPT